MNSIKERFDSMDGTKSEAVQKIQERFQPNYLNKDLVWQEKVGPRLLTLKVLPDHSQ